MQKIVVATKNKGKIQEIKQILIDLPVGIVSMEDEGIDIEIIEDGQTFEENALIKAKAVKKFTDAMVLADDSGLEVDCLGGAPGIYSSRFAGENAGDEENNAKLLSLMEGIKEQDRTARFVCAVAVIMPDGSYFIEKGELAGRIGFKPVGQNGFGYDPLFYVPEYNATIAELEPEIKNAISHRAKALKKVKEKILRSCT